MTGTRHTLFAYTFVLGLTSLTGLWPEKGHSSQPTEELKAPEGYPCDDEFCLTERQEGATWHLEYRFKDLQEKWRTVACDISEDDNVKLGLSYGYTELQHTRELAIDREKTINLATRMSPFGFRYGKAHVDDKVHWLPAWKFRSMDEEQLFESEQEKFSAWYEQHKKALNDQANATFLTAHKFMNVPELGEIPDYSALVAESAGALDQCIVAFDEAAGDQPELVQRFFQSMFFLEIPLQYGDRKTGGLLLPTTVMIKGIGDCDSKAAAFCALQSKQRRRLVILRSLPGLGSPKHALVGVEAWKKNAHYLPETWRHKRLPEALRAILYGDPIRIGVRDYWPCEVAGRVWTDFGQVAEPHAGHYMAIRIR